MPGSLGMLRGGYFQLADFTTQLRCAVELNVALDGVADIFQSLGHGCALGMAARQFGATDGHALGMFQQRDVVFAFHLMAGYAPALVSSIRSAPPKSFVSLFHLTLSTLRSASICG